MLILTRNIGESILIGEEGEIKITVFDSSRPNQVRFGIDAPKDVPIHREEIFYRIHQHKAEEAAKEETNGN